MNIWLVTTGSSDVQLKSNEYWNEWYYGSQVKKNCHSLEFNPTQIFEDSEEPYRIAPRILGRVYEAQQDEVWKCLTFPLLDQFTNQLKGTVINQIILLLTDQSQKFEENLQEDRRCPYWQDTCQLQLIIERYFKQSNKFPNSELIPIILSPRENEPGLDDWNHVLKIVQNKLHELKFESEPNRVYVSHQAGTPAISSAVQFVSLGRFGTKVQFLVSNEYEKKALEPIESSEYLKGIKFEQAKALLENHDYAAIQSLVNDYLDSDTKILLDAAIQWNYAKFDGFANEMQKLSDRALVEQVNERSQYWWWTGYEAAYLAAIRHRQKNIVEALFHSFRSVEGLVCQWAEEKYKDYIIYNKKGSPQITEKIQAILPKYWEKMTKKNSAWIEQQNKENESLADKKTLSVGLFSQSLYSLLECVRPECKQDPSLKKGLYSAKDERNQQFHRLLGLCEEDLFKAWKADDIDSWKSILLGCLNFIAEHDLPEQKKFISLEEASLMAQVYQKLKEAIASYQP